jgi:hypothetical protein
MGELGMTFTKNRESKADKVSHSDVFALASAINTELGKQQRMNPHFSGAHAAAAGPAVSVRYHSSQEPFLLDYHRAIRYLEWVQAGNYGRHHEMESQQVAQ